MLGGGSEPNEVDLGPRPLGLRISSTDELGKGEGLSSSVRRGRTTATLPSPAELLACLFFPKANMLDMRRIVWSERVVPLAEMLFRLLFRMVQL
jgi:hypothetical protein